MAPIATNPAGTVLTIPQAGVRAMRALGWEVTDEEKAPAPVPADSTPEADPAETGDEGTGENTPADPEQSEAETPDGEKDAETADPADPAPPVEAPAPEPDKPKPATARRSRKK